MLTTIALPNTATAAVQQWLLLMILLLLQKQTTKTDNFTTGTNLLRERVIIAVALRSRYWEEEEEEEEEAVFTHESITKCVVAEEEFIHEQQTCPKRTDGFFGPFSPAAVSSLPPLFFLCMRWDKPVAAVTVVVVGVGVGVVEE